MDKYSFDNAWTAARQRLRGLEQLLDPGSVRHLEALGVGEGLRCLEVGAGSGSLTEWLCQRVGPGGSVLATDLEPRFLEGLNFPNLRVQRHNIVGEDLLEHGFDLVLSRMVLGHLPEREKAVQRMAAALKPGGWLVCEDSDNAVVALLSPADEASRTLFANVERAKDQAMAAHGHRYCGRELYGFLRAAGLADVRAEGRVPLLYGGTPAAEWKRLSVEQLRGEMVQAGLASAREIEAYLALFELPDFTAQGFLVMTAWGRRPAENAV